MKIKFSESALRRLELPEGARDCQWFDDSLPGFGIRIFSSGKASYFLKYKIGKQQRRITLGPYAPGVLEQMRCHAAEMRFKIKQGLDLQKSDTSNRDDLSRLGEVIPQYLEARRGDTAPLWHIELERFLTRYWKEFHDRRLNELERGELVRALDDIAKQRGSVTADHSRKALSGLFNWSLERGLADANPLTRVRNYAKGNDRDRVLSLSELVAVWVTRGDRDYGRAVGLLLLTLQRRGEIANLSWSEIELEYDLEIRLPRERTKNKRPHTVPLGRETQKILLSANRRVGRDYCFGEGERGLSGWSKAKWTHDVRIRRLMAPELMARLEAISGDLTIRAKQPRAEEAARALKYSSCHELFEGIMPRWTLHDLRRTGATLMNDFNLAEPHIIEAILNHISGSSRDGVAGVYNRAKYEPQKRVALERWEGFVTDALAHFEARGFDGVLAFERREKQKLRDG